MDCRPIFSVPESAPAEDKAVVELVNRGLCPRQLARASITLYQHLFERELAARGRVVVQDGLFKGLVVYPGSLASSLIAKWQGTYEKELQASMAAHAPGCDGFVDIGCAEGFYLGGVARWLSIPCYGVDIDPRSGAAVRYVAAENGLESSVHLADSVATAVSRCSGRLMVLVDVDGAELSVLAELQQALVRQQGLREVLLYVETDRDASGGSNAPALMEQLIGWGWSMQALIPQNPSNRFVASAAEHSFLEQAIRGAEGRPGAQSWIMATRSF